MLVRVKVGRVRKKESSYGEIRAKLSLKCCFFKSETVVSVLCLGESLKGFVHIKDLVIAGHCNHLLFNHYNVPHRIVL